MPTTVLSDPTYREILALRHTLAALDREHGVDHGVMARLVARLFALEAPWVAERWPSWRRRSDRPRITEE